MGTTCSTASDVVKTAISARRSDDEKPDQSSKQLSNALVVDTVKSRTSDVSVTAAMLPPAKLSDLYDLKKVLGRGNFSTVREGIPKKAIKGREKVAVKCIDKKKLTKQDLVALRKETEILQQLKHPNIIRMYEVFEEDHMYYIVTEFIPGGELFERIVQKEYYGEEDAQTVLVRVAKALQYCHSKGVVHRDLKPENILLASTSDDANIKLIDFGFARTIDTADANSNSLETACGTPGYVAPEIISGKGYGKEVDVWSLGVILYILLCGYPPFRNDNRGRLFRLIRKGDYKFEAPWWDDVSDQAKDLVKRMLTVKPEERITLPELFNHPWLKESVHRDLTPALAKLSEFNAKRKLRGAHIAVSAVGAFSRGLKGKPAKSVKALAAAARAGAAAKKTATAPTAIADVEVKFEAGSISELARDVTDFYTLGEVLGKGHFAQVRKAVSKRDKKVVRAVKCVDKMKLSPKDLLALKRETNILRELEHPNILRMHECFETDKVFYIVTDFVPGGELFERIVQKEYYGEEDAQELMARLANALMYCHSKGVVHRDLKPENILMASTSDDADIKLIDFGFARTVDAADANSLETACGTPGYVAPEVINGKKYGKEVDVWSLGVILYIMLCGYPPFRQKNRAELFASIRTAKFVFDEPWWDEVSDTAKDVVKRMLTVDPKERITLPQLMNHSWMKDVVKRDITPALSELKQFNASRRIRIGGKAVTAISMFKAAAARGSNAEANPEPLNPSSGKLQDFYELKEVLGKGNFSTVRAGYSVSKSKKSKSNKPPQKVAVKCITKKKLSAKDLDALKRETAILKQLDHPNIMKMQAVFETEEMFYIVTDFAPGGELFERIVQKEYYGEEDAQVLLLRVAKALQYCHSKGVVHRDLKPENILMSSTTDDADIEICDFGFARTVDSEDANSLETACGTPGYVAPEIINGKKYGKEVDVWSLGVILYILLCGYPPFRQENRAKMFKAIRKGAYEFDSPWWDDVSEQAKDVVRRMLTVNVEDRITLPQLMDHPWLKDSVHRDLTPALRELTKFNAKRRLKVGTSAIQAVARLTQLGAFGAAKRKTSSAA